MSEAFTVAADMPFETLRNLRKVAGRLALEAARDGGTPGDWTVSDLVVNDLRDSDLTEYGGFLANRRGVAAGDWEYNLVPDGLTGPTEAIVIYGFAALSALPVWGELELTDAPVAHVFAGLNLRTLYVERQSTDVAAAAGWIGYFSPVTFAPAHRIVINGRALTNVVAGAGTFTLIGAVADTRVNRIERFASRSRGESA